MYHKNVTFLHTCIPIDTRTIPRLLEKVAINYERIFRNKTRTKKNSGL